MSMSMDRRAGDGRGDGRGDDVHLSSSSYSPSYSSQARNNIGNVSGFCFSADCIDGFQSSQTLVV